MIGVINYQTGNSQSVIYALEGLGIPCRLVSTPQDCDGVDRYVLPGVGSAGVTMRSLDERGWVAHLAGQVLHEGVPFLGICVGLQVLFQFSAEGGTDCLGWLPGKVEEFDRGSVRVPHIGWNAVRPQSEHPFTRALPRRGHFYFVNSFYAVPENPGDVAGMTEYGVSFAAVVARGNIMATQFHTEKSGPVGLKLLAHFASLDKEELSAHQ